MDRVAGAKWGSCYGQACIGIDYLLVEEKYAPTLVPFFFIFFLFLIIHNNIFHGERIFMPQINFLQVVTPLLYFFLKVHHSDTNIPNN
jgi:hypothetical protein